MDRGALIASSPEERSDIRAAVAESINHGPAFRYCSCGLLAMLNPSYGQNAVDAHARLWLATLRQLGEVKLKYVLALLLTLTVTPAFAGMQPKYQDYMSKYSQIKQQIDVNKAKLGKKAAALENRLEASRTKMTESYNRMMRPEYYALADKEFAVLARIQAEIR